MSFLIGAAGALLFVGIFCTGVVVGWKAHAKYAVQKSDEKATEEELRKIREQDEAFRSLTGYSAEDAYGLVSRTGDDGG